MYQSYLLLFGPIVSHSLLVVDNTITYIIQDVVATSHVPDEVLPEGEPALAQGLVFQKEINYFRRGRGGVVRTYIVP